MRYSKPITLLIPALLKVELLKYLRQNPPNFRYDINNFYYIISSLACKCNTYKDQEFVNLNLNKLRLITVSNIRRYIRILIIGEFIISDKKYQTGIKSLWYKLNPEYVKGCEKVKISNECKLFKKTVKNHRAKRKHDNRLVPHIKIMRDTFMNMDIDYLKAEKWIQKNVPNNNWYYYLLSLNQLQDNRFRYFKRNKTNSRLDSNLTVLPTSLRQYIIGNYTSIDLKNSQPFFLSVIIKTIINKQRNPLCCYLDYDYLARTFGIKALRDISKIPHLIQKQELANLRNYNNSVLKGSLYEDFIRLYPNNLTRKEAKDIIFKVLFSRNEVSENFKVYIPFEKEKEIFKNTYPYVSEVVKILKNKDHTLLPVYLQKLESYIFIDCVAKKLCEEGIVPLTIHDSLIVKTKDKEKAPSIIEGVFQKYLGLIPSFHIENLKKDK